MSNLRLPDVTDLDSARKFLGERQQARLAYATTIRRGTGGDVLVRHHGTDIVRYLDGGGIWLVADGWVTATTATRMHRLTPPHVRVGRKGGDFLVTLHDGDPITWDGTGVFAIPA